MKVGACPTSSPLNTEAALTNKCIKTAFEHLQKPTNAKNNSGYKRVTAIEGETNNQMNLNLL